MIEGEDKGKGFLFEAGGAIISVGKQMKDDGQQEK